VLFRRPSDYLVTLLRQLGLSISAEVRQAIACYGTTALPYLATTERSRASSACSR
jgi:hypothetical protein